LLNSLGELTVRSASLVAVPRGLGLLAGLELFLANGLPATEATLKLIQALLRRGFIFLPEGEHANVISFTPPLTIAPNQLKSAVAALGEFLRVQ